MEIQTKTTKTNPIIIAYINHIKKYNVTAMNCNDWII